MDEAHTEHHRKDGNDGMYAIAIAVIVSTIILSGIVVYAANGVNANLQQISTNVQNLKLSVNVQGGSQPTATATPTANPTTQPEPQIDMAALSDDDPALGPKDAKVTIVEFTDFECPYCGAAAGTHQVLMDRLKAQDPTWTPADPKLIELAKAGKIRFVVRDFPLTQIHPDAQKAAEASECADEQGKYWEMHDKLFASQSALKVADLKKYAADLKLDTAKFNDCLDSGKMAAEVNKDLGEGVAVGVQGTPAFIVNGQLVSGAVSASAFEQFINAAV